MTFSLRRLIITVVFVLIISVISIVGVFLSTFDLNHFRAEISDSISVRLSQPVDLGQAHFSIKHGPSFAFDTIRIGTAEAPLHLTAKHIFFRLEVLPLLIGKFKFSEALFENPMVNLKIGQQPASAKGGRLVLDQSLLSGDLIRSIRIKNGNFRIEDYRNAQTPFIVALEKVRMVIDDLTLRRSGWVEIRTNINCNNIVSPFHLKGYIRAGDSTPFWNQAHYQLEMRISDFASDILSQRYWKGFSELQINGRTDIHTELSGSPADGLTFSTILTGRDLGLKLPNRAQPIPARRIAVSGIWENTGSSHKFDNLKVQFDTLNFSGRTHFDLDASDPFVYAKVIAPRLEMTDLNRFIEQKQGSPEFLAGTINLRNLEISGPISHFSGPNLLLAIKKINVEIRQGAFSVDAGTNFSNFSLVLEKNNQQLAIKQLKLDTGRLHIETVSELDIERLGGIESLHVTGKTNLNLSNSTQIDSPDPLLFPPDGLNAVLHLDTTHTDGTWTFNNNLLAIPSIKLLLQGKWDRKKGNDYSFDIVLPEFNLADLPLVSPAIRALEPEGTSSAEVHIQGSGSKPPQLSGKLLLEHVHFSIAGPMADLDELNGTIDLDWPRLSGEKLVATLGASPISLGLDIPDLTRLQVNLAIKSKSIRADELIFRSERTYLRDVDARLSLNDQALILGPIKTRMDGGTDVTINGTIDNFPTADTRLNIEGAYGNIDEVIGLWISDQDRTHTKRKKRKPGLLEIDIKTDAGEIAHLPFESSAAHISFRDRTLIIHPLRFQSGGGFGNGQVLVEFRDDQPPLLRMSGHLEDFDALAVYQQLLQRKGIVTGTLKGDFYLEGTAGNLKNVFLPSSTGSFNFTVKNGVLEKLKGLSKTLTVFNIYPLFTSSDSSKGVPFNTLRGHALLKEGLLQSDDIFMKGNVMNMSLTGTHNLITSDVDMELGIMPLRTIDRLLTNIPLAGWILTGENKALVTAHFKMTGPADNPEITAIPLESVSKQTLGIFKRIFTLPVKIISDVGKAIDQPTETGQPLPSGNDVLQTDR